MRIIRHGKLPIRLISDDPLTLDMLDTISINMKYDEENEDLESPWSYWVDEYGEWFNPYKKNKKQMELFDEDWPRSDSGWRHKGINRLL